MSDDAAPDGPDMEPAVVVVCMLSAALAPLVRAPTRRGGWFLQVEPQLNDAGRWTNVLAVRCELGSFSITVEPLELTLFACPRCGARSANATDLVEGYCGRCHDWTALDHEPMNRRMPSP